MKITIARCQIRMHVHHSLAGATLAFLASCASCVFCKNTDLPTIMAAPEDARPTGPWPGPSGGAGVPSNRQFMAEMRATVAWNLP